MPTRIEKLANNSTMYYRGDSCMEIAPFTNYYIFTIYRESNDETTDDSIPLNLTNLGTIWLSFISGSTKIRISNYTEAENVDTANGEVVFRISAEDANRILALSSKTFYISACISDGTTSSDETVLFSGSWSEYSSAMSSALTDTVTELKSQITNLQTEMQNNTEEWNTKLSELQSEIDSLKSENDKLSAQNIELENKLASVGETYIDATIISDNTIPQSSNTNNSSSKQINAELQANVKSLEKTAIKSTFKYNL